MNSEDRLTIGAWIFAFFVVGGLVGFFLGDSVQRAFIYGSLTLFGLVVIFVAVIGAQDALSNFQSDRHGQPTINAAWGNAPATKAFLLEIAGQSARTGFRAVSIELPEAPAQHFEAKLRSDAGGTRIVSITVPPAGAATHVLEAGWMNGDGSRHRA